MWGERGRMERMEEERVSEGERVRGVRGERAGQTSTAGGYTTTSVRISSRWSSSP